MAKNILVVEDEEGIRDYLKTLLIENNFSVKAVSEGTRGIKAVEKIRPDLVILDLGLPDITGESVCQAIKKMFPELPVIMLTARDTLSDEVKGLETGADDYITKPFEADVLLARIKARLREKGDSHDVLKVSDLELNRRTMEVKRSGKLIKLTPQEFKLLDYLMSNKNQVLTREMILNRIWLYSPDIETRVVDVYVGYLRKKIDKGFEKKLIQSMRGFGYTIKE